jgi:hypothetical protein
VVSILKNSITFLNKRTFPTNNLGKMATNRDLLKEAIADAKAVKETAIANAKAALEEAFTPQLKSMFAAKLQEIEDDTNLEEMYGMSEDEKELEEAGFGDFDTKDNAGFGKMNAKALDEEGLDEYRELQPSDLPKGMSGVKKDEKIDEIDLEELLRELELEEGDMEGLYEAEEDDDDDMKMSDEDSDEGDEEGTPLDLEDMTDEDLKTMIEDVIKDMIAAGEIEGGEEKMGSEVGIEMKDEEEVDLAELLREIEDIESLDEAKKKKEKEEKKEEKEDEDKKKMKKELDEAYSVIKSLKSELNEINLLNAKLLYTNKIFKAKNLNESQKVKVLSSFDKATTVGEVKLVFETLNEGIKVKSNLIKENLGSASKSTVTPSVKKPIVESNDAFLRMQKLAGII